MGAISEIKSAVDLLQELTKYIKKSANYDPQVIQDLEGLRGKILDAYSTEIELRQKLHELEEQLAIRKLPYDTDMATYFQLAESGDKEFFVNDAWMLNGICVDFNAWITGITAVLVKNFIKLRRKELLIIPTPSIPAEIVMTGMVGSH